MKPTLPRIVACLLLALPCLAFAEPRALGEIVTTEKIGMETTTYVRNIYNDYVACKLMLDAQATAEQARKTATR